MGSIGIIGDIHGKVDLYHKLIKESEASKTIQIGDFALGFSRELDEEIYAYLDDLNKDESSHKFFRGNHDDPKVCNNCSHYMGDWGYQEDTGIFWIAGAWSIDHARRTKDIDWWEDEELKEEQWEEVREAYARIKPRFVLSHDAPLDMYAPMFSYYGKRIIPTLTSRELNGLFYIHQPEKWIFGHHHLSVTQDNRGCEFRCLNELEIYELRI